jgi:hypothetical protein
MRLCAVCSTSPTASRRDRTVRLGQVAQIFHDLLSDAPELNVVLLRLLTQYVACFVLVDPVTNINMPLACSINSRLWA